MGWIHPSSSPFGALLLLFYKKKGALWIYIDYFLLNMSTHIDAYPIRHINDIIEGLSRTTFFTKMDLYQGQYWIKVHQGFENKTAFICHY